MSFVPPRPLSNHQWVKIMPDMSNMDNRPYKFMHLSFKELPYLCQKLLKEEGLYPPIGAPGPDPIKYFPILYEVRNRRRERMKRTLHGVCADIAKHLHPWPPIGDSMTTLHSVLFPEWRSHLDAYVREIDALMWFDVEVRKGTLHEHLPSPATILKERRSEVETVVEFALKEIDVERMYLQVNWEEWNQAIVR